MADDGCGMAPGRNGAGAGTPRHLQAARRCDRAGRRRFGFRGEALPSIASVARLTHRKPGARRRRLARIVDNGELAGEGPAALPPGTRVTVEDLFDKVPARRKFLRSARAEYAACLDVVKRLAMARPDIGFTLDHDGRRILAVQPGEDRPARVAALTDRELADNGVAIDYARGDGRGWAASSACRPSTAASPTSNICSSTAGR